MRQSNEVLAFEAASRVQGRETENHHPHVVVIGGGIAGLAAAHQLTKLVPQAAVTLLERDQRLGGKIITERIDGFVIEGGPESLIAAKPRSIELCQELGLGDRMNGPNAGANRTFILRRGRLRQLPDGLSGIVPTRLRPIVLSNLFSPLGKLRMGFDVVVPRRRDDEDETLAAFIERRLGREAYERLVEPLTGAIYAGDGRRLSLAATFPQLRRLEREYGSLIKSTLAAQRSAAKSAAGGPRPSPLLAPRSGLAEVTEALARILKSAQVQIMTGVDAVELSRTGETDYAVTCATGETFRADAVICATPSRATADLTAGLDAVLADHLWAIPHASIATISLAYPLRDVPRSLDGSGYVRPRSEGRPVRACTWVSSKWQGRAPADHALLRVSIGGAGWEEILKADDDHLVSIARSEVRQVLGIAASPTLARVFRWPQGMPQYEVGHLDRVATIESRLAAAHPGLALAGSAYHGVGLADCIQSGERAAERIRSFVEEKK